MVATSLRDKLGVKAGPRCVRLHAPEAFAPTVGVSPAQCMERLAGGFDYIHFFATEHAELHEALPRFQRHLRKTGMLWVSWPKAEQLSTGLNLKGIIRLAYDTGLVESKTGRRHGRAGSRLRKRKPAAK